MVSDTVHEKKLELARESCFRTSELQYQRERSVIFEQYCIGRQWPPFLLHFPHMQADRMTVARDIYGAHWTRLAHIIRFIRSLVLLRFTRYNTSRFVAIKSMDNAMSSFNGIT